MTDSPVSSKGGIIKVNGQPYLAQITREGDLIHLTLRTQIMSPIVLLEATIPACEHCADHATRPRPIEICRSCDRNIVEVRI